MIHPKQNFELKCQCYTIACSELTRASGDVRNTTIARRDQLPHSSPHAPSIGPFRCPWTLP